MFNTAGIYVRLKWCGKFICSSRWNNSFKRVAGRKVPIRCTCTADHDQSLSDGLAWRTRRRNRCNMKTFNASQKWQLALVLRVNCSFNGNPMMDDLTPREPLAQSWP